MLYKHRYCNIHHWHASKPQKLHIEETNGGFTSFLSVCKWSESGVLLILSPVILMKLLTGQGEILMPRHTLT